MHLLLSFLWNPQISTMMSFVTSLRISGILMSSDNFLSESPLISLISYDHASIHASSHLLSCQQLSLVELSGVTPHSKSLFSLQCPTTFPSIIHMIHFDVACRIRDSTPSLSHRISKAFPNKVFRSFLKTFPLRLQPITGHPNNMCLFPHVISFSILFGANALALLSPVARAFLPHNQTIDGLLPSGLFP